MATLFLSLEREKPFKQHRVPRPSSFSRPTSGVRLDSTIFLMLERDKLFQTTEASETYLRCIVAREISSLRYIESELPRAGIRLFGVTSNTNLTTVS